MAKAAPKAPSKTEVLKNIADASGLDKNDVAKVIDALADEIKKNLSPQGPGVFAIPGLVKIERKTVPAKPEQKGVPRSLQARRVAGYRRQAGLGEDQGPGLEEPQGHGGVKSGNPKFECRNPKQIQTKEFKRLEKPGVLDFLFEFRACLGFPVSGFGFHFAQPRLDQHLRQQFHRQPDHIRLAAFHHMDPA